MTNVTLKKQETGKEKNQEFLEKLIMILLSLGSNLPSKFGDSKNTILKCYEFFNNNDIKILKKSSFYETFAIPNNL